MSKCVKPPELLDCDGKVHQAQGDGLSATREFEYKGRQVKISATKIPNGKYIGVPVIDGQAVSGRALGEGKGRVNEALGEGERRAKDLIDSQA